MSLSPIFAASLMLFAMLILLLIMLGTLGQGTSPLPSNRNVRRVILRQLSPHGGPILELGAGYGSLAFAVARHCPARTVIAYERAWLPWLTGRLLTAVLRPPNLVWRRGNIFNQPLPEAQDWLCYLGPEQMQRLARVLTNTPRPPCQLISNTFRLPGYADEEYPVQLKGIYQTHIYCYRLSASRLSISV